MEGIKNTSTEEFVSVDLNDFFDKPEEINDQDAEIEALSPHQKEMYDHIISVAKTVDPVKYEVFEERMRDLQKLAESIANFPSLLERHNLSGGERTPQSLIDSLIKHQPEGDITLQLPSKATLGKGFLVAKIHTFSSLYKFAKSIKQPDAVWQELQQETITLMCSLLAEDVYLNLLHDPAIPLEFKQELAMRLLLLWEHRTDQNVSDIAPTLLKIWTARRKLAPAFGTMMGTSELLMLSMQLDDQWTTFMKAKLGDTGVSQAMEEFLFGISHEQILQLKEILKTKGIPAIGRDEVSNFLGVHIKADAGLDYRDFYSLYTVRRDNARVRERMHLPGPHKTIEDYFIQFVMEQEKEKQNNDSFAK
ncbi:MAG: hypothetical protein MJ184_05955 [Treponema sp.]|uniref:hypothetical protein n=1 Tax=Treponema sp. TaxID=166 RepID=UPI00298DB067|nr:hypothetical protein [Treponema sp.]MCQ2600889.1 hypothetical protein [Treponema sp.]